MRALHVFVVSLLAVGCTKPQAAPSVPSAPTAPESNAAQAITPGMIRGESRPALDVERREADHAKDALDELERKVFEIGSSLAELRGRQEAAKNGTAADRDEMVATLQKQIDEAEKSVAKLKEDYKTAYEKWLDCEKRMSTTDAGGNAVRDH